MNIAKLFNRGVQAIGETTKKAPIKFQGVSKVVENSNEQLALALDALAIQNRIGKKIGILSKKGIVSSCLDVGDVLSKQAKVQNSKLNVKDIDDAVRKVFPNSRNITISQDYEVFRKFMKELGYSDIEIKMFSNSALGLAVSNPKTNQTLLRIGNTDGFKADEIINLSTHELEHALYKTYSLPCKTGVIQTKLMPKYADKAFQKASLLNKKIMEMQQQLLVMSGFGPSAVTGVFNEVVADRQGLVKVLQVDSFEKMQDKIRNVIRSTVVLPDNNKDNILFLKTAKKLFEDEARAYKVGGLNAGKCLNLEAGCTKSEMYSKFYDEVVGVLDEEIKLQRKNQLRKLSGKPQIDYHIEPQNISSPLDLFADALSKATENTQPISIDDLLKNHQ